jgi:zinc protease
VLGEYNKNSANPIEALRGAARDAFTTHTYKHTTMGFLEDIEDMPNQFEYSKVFFDRWYRPEYTTVIVAGDVTREVLPLVEKYWGGWKRGSYAVEIPRAAAVRGRSDGHVDWSTPTLPWVTVAFHGPAFSDEREGLRGDRHADGPLLRPDLAALQAPRRRRAEGRSALRRTTRRAPTRSSRRSLARA